MCIFFNKYIIGPIFKGFASLDLTNLRQKFSSMFAWICRQPKLQIWRAGCSMPFYRTECSQILVSAEKHGTHSLRILRDTYISSVYVNATVCCSLIPLGGTGNRKRYQLMWTLWKIPLLISHMKILGHYLQQNFWCEPVGRYFTGFGAKYVVLTSKHHEVQNSICRHWQWL